LYSVHEGLNEKLRIVINHPLTHEEFDAAWNALVDEYGIRENVAIDGLWRQRELWIPVYFKKYYCGRMTSTHRSESEQDGERQWIHGPHDFSEHICKIASPSYSTHKS
jgi:hypothetical protein